MSATRLLHRTLKFRLYPTPEQDLRLRSWCGAVRAAYNAALQQRQWYGRAIGTDPHGRDTRFNSVRQARELQDLRAEFDWMRDCPSKALNAALRDLDRSFRSRPKPDRPVILGGNSNSSLPKQRPPYIG